MCLQLECILSTFHMGRGCQARLHARPNLAGGHSAPRGSGLRRLSAFQLEASAFCGVLLSAPALQVPQFLLEEAISRGSGGACNIIVTQACRVHAWRMRAFLHTHDEQTSRVHAWWCPVQRIAQRSSVSVALINSDDKQRSCTHLCRRVFPCLQPRRISAVGLAGRVAAERGEGVGATVGYSVRLDSKQSARTRLLFCTTGAGGVAGACLHDSAGAQRALPVWRLLDASLPASQSLSCTKPWPCAPWASHHIQYLFAHTICYMP